MRENLYVGGVKEGTDFCEFQSAVAKDYTNATRERAVFKFVGSPCNFQLYANGRFADAVRARPETRWFRCEKLEVSRAEEQEKAA